MTRPTSKPTDESAISSLGELMRLEKERVVEKERGRLREHQAKLAKDQETAERLLRDEASKNRAAAEAAAARDREAALAIARLEAEKAGSIERERVLAVEGAREAAREKEREHELSIKRLELRAAAEKSPVAGLVGYAVAVVVLFGALGLHFGMSKPAADAKNAELSDRADKESAALGRAKDDVVIAKARADRLERDLSDSRTRVSALELEVSALKAAKVKPGATLVAGALVPARPVVPVVPVRACENGDPLCPTIGGR